MDEEITQEPEKTIKELPNISDETSKPDQEELILESKSLLKLDFIGVAEVILKNNPGFLKKKAKYLDIVYTLNKFSTEITDEITRELKSKIPVGLDVKAQVEFKAGSIEFDGIIQIIDFLDKLNGAKELVISVATLVINNILRREIEEKGDVTVKKIETNVTVGKVSGDNINPLTKLLWWCAGTTSEIIKNCPTDKTKYQTIGVTIIVTGIIAALSSGYALYTVFDDGVNGANIGILFGLLWGFAIFNIDRSIVASMRKETDENYGWWRRFAKEFPPAIPRILFAVLIGITMTKPLELRIFKDRIQKQITINHNKDSKVNSDVYRSTRTPRIGEIDNRLAQIEAERDKFTQAKTKSETAYREEMNGSGGTRKRGVGAIAEQNRILLSNAEADLANVKKNTETERSNLLKEKNDISLGIDDYVKSYQRNVPDDFLSRLEAFWDLTASNEGIRWINIALILLVIGVEISPIFVKLLSSAGVYEARVNQREKTEVKDAELRKDTVITEAEYNKDTATDKAMYKYQATSETEAIRKNSIVDIARNHFTHVTASENQFDVNFFNMTDQKREIDLQKDVNMWDSDNTSYDEFYRNEKAKLSLNQVI